VATTSVLPVLDGVGSCSVNVKIKKPSTIFASTIGGSSKKRCSRQRRAARMDYMDDVQDQIELLQIEITRANAAITKAVSDRRAVSKDSPLVADLNAAIVAAREALTAVEVKLRKLYESKSDD